MAATKPPSLQELAGYPRMTAWFQPVLLAKLLWRVVVSDLFGQYADGRLIVAALDPVSETELVARAKQFVSENADDEVWAFRPDANGSIWIDFVADLGDGFDATYAIASLLAQETLPVGGHVTRRGQLLVMGGDEVYPNASLENYSKRLRDPYDWAFPDPYPELGQGAAGLRHPRQSRLVRRAGAVPGPVQPQGAPAPGRLALVSAAQLFRAAADRQVVDLGDRRAAR